MRFCSLASGSAGNCAFVATEKTRILVDCGLSQRELRKRLKLIGEDVERIDGVLITHEHGDHVAGVPVLRDNRAFPGVFYLASILHEAEQINCGQRVEVFDAGKRFTVGDIEVQSFLVPHDAVDPVGFWFRSGGIKVAFTTDLGFIPDSVAYHLEGADLVFIEANHDTDMLKVGPYPFSVKQRVMSRMGHLSNEHIAEFIEKRLDRGTSHLVLGHLSEQNNHPAIVEMTAREALDARGIKASLTLALQDRPTQVFEF